MQSDGARRWPWVAIGYCTAAAVVGFTAGILDTLFSDEAQQRLIWISSVTIACALSFRAGDNWGRTRLLAEERGGSEAVERQISAHASLESTERDGSTNPTTAETLTDRT